MTGSRWGAFVVAAALLLSAGSAWADPTAQEKERARDLMADGRDKRDKSDLAGALASFQQADAIMHVPTTAFEVAKTQEALGQLVEAEATCAAIVKSPVAANEPPPFAEARKNAEQLAKDLDGKVPKLTIAVHAASAVVSVTVDNVVVVNPDQPIRLNPGNHAVHAKSSDGETKADIALAAGESRSLELTISAPVMAATPTGKKSSVPVLAWAGFGLGVAGVAVGTVTGIIALGDKSDLTDHCPQNHCTRAQADNLSSAKHMATVSTVGFIVGGVGVAVGVVGLILGRSHSASDDAAPPTATLGPVHFHPTTLSGTF